MNKRKKSIILLLIIFSLSHLPFSLYGILGEQGFAKENLSLQDYTHYSQGPLISTCAKGIGGFIIGTAVACTTIGVIKGILNKKTNIKQDGIITLTALCLGGLANVFVHRYPKIALYGSAFTVSSLLALGTVGYYIANNINTQPI